MQRHVDDPNKPEVLAYPDAEALAPAAARFVLALATRRVAETGSFMMVLAGGNTPRGLYQCLAQPPFLHQMPWQHMHVLWGDERYVVPTSPDSNYRMAHDALLRHVPLTSRHIYPIPTGLESPQKAAADYDWRVWSLLTEHQGRFDLVLLGLGADGHIASLFPQHPALALGQDVFATVVDDAPKPPSVRITLTPSALNRAANVLFLVTGADKAPVLRRVLSETDQAPTLPAQYIRPTGGNVTWMVDTAAAGGSR